MFVKICGITTEEDALVAIALGADAVGLIFAPSPRQISPVEARDIARRMPKDALTVGVFRNDSRESVVRTVSEAGLGAAQLHGLETPEDCAWIAERVPVVIKGFVAELGNLERAHEYSAKYVLVDAVAPGAGQVFDWSLAENAPRGLKLIMAGGLTPDNVGAAIAKVRPWGVDTASGVEASPGHKDPVLVRQFVEAARRAAAELDVAEGGSGGGDGGDGAGDNGFSDVIYDWDRE